MKCICKYIMLSHAAAIFKYLSSGSDGLCGLVVSGYRSRGPGSISGATRYSEK
jgi:hypothetical protein